MMIISHDEDFLQSIGVDQVYFIDRATQSLQLDPLR